MIPIPPGKVIVIKCAVPSKKNKLRPRSARSRGRAHMYDDETNASLLAIETYARIAWGPDRVAVHPRVDVQFEVTNASQDRDGMWTTVLDCLKKARVIHDDNIRWFNGTIIHHPAKIVPFKPGPRIILTLSEEAHDLAPSETDRAARAAGRSTEGGRRRGSPVRRRQAAADADGSR